MKPEQLELIETVLKYFNFTGLDDRETSITRKDAVEHLKDLEKMKPNILKYIPKDYTIRIRNGLYSGREVICALRQLIRFTKDHRLVAKKKQMWNKQTKQTEARYHYHII
jgi:hypothetical protein